jgi:hypothetical protein
MTDSTIGVPRPRLVRVARDLRRGDVIEINRKLVTVEFTSWIPARLDQRAISMMTRGRDLEGRVSVHGRNEDGRTVCHEFSEGDIFSIC